ncbi:ABC transporter substrate-binding protein [Auraticoccus monumenti]|uniref:Carbohydrate ABC transporter substrate-binding protein, CUT1 family n=1 Tax=Auraticoccus monumenti TaxID=675864 RepID=A0A1G6Y6A7_9ACTN|nr:extracellular solute-binding protein [Auraticoccus monumenti]SDD85812.1 carbohydrate ABC transporter substrate-binding protein, CUT1 family [Auraticoccus monumenti]
MSVSRRQFLMASGGIAAVAVSGGLTACGSGGSGSADGSAELTFTWWGNEVRNANTSEAIAAYQEANPDITIAEQPGEWASYWDKLATQTAGNTTPDVIQMDMAYITEYGSRGALLDLEEHGVDVSKFAEGTVDSGRIDGKLYGVNAGINTPVILANPELFEEAGMDLPDDTTWTWEEASEIAAELTSKLGDGRFGMASIFNDVMLSAWLRQNGKELFVPEGLGFGAEDAVGWFELQQSFMEAEAIPGPAQISEDSTKSLDQGDLATGKVAMAQFWSNQVEAVNAASGVTMTMLRFPSTTGQATDRQAWYKASMLWSASARSENPEAAVALINWWVNSSEAAQANLAERGIPANTERLEEITPSLSEDQQGVAAFIAEIEPELGTTPIAPPPGGGGIGDIMLRYQLEMLFGRASGADAARGFVEEAAANMKV